MGAALVPLMVIGGVMSAVGQIQAGNAAKKAGDYNATVQQNNATISKQNATYAGQEGEQNVATEQQKTRQQVSAMLANQAASGVDVNSGSAVDVRASQEEVGMLDASNIRANAARAAYGYQTQAYNFEQQAVLDKEQGKQAKKAAYIGAATSLLGAATSTSKYSSWQSSKGLQGPTLSGATLDTVAGGY